MSPGKGDCTNYGSSETGYGFQQIRGEHKCNSGFLIMQTLGKINILDRQEKIRTVGRRVSKS